VASAITAAAGGQCAKSDFLGFEPSFVAAAVSSCMTKIGGSSFRAKFRDPRKQCKDGEYCECATSAASAGIGRERVLLLDNTFGADTFTMVFLFAAPRSKASMVYAGHLFEDFEGCKPRTSKGRALQRLSSAARRFVFAFAGWDCK
jgi:hypothetical protein